MASENLSSLMDLNRTEETHVHVTHVSERASETSTGLTTPLKNAAPLTQTTVPEGYIDNKRMLMSEIRYDSFQWSTSQAAGTNFLVKNLPDIFAQVASFHRTALRTYCFYRPTLTLRLQVNATPQHMGLLRLWWDPMSQYALTSSDFSARGNLAPPANAIGQISPKDPNIFATSGQPCVELQASNSSPVTLTIPFEHLLDCLTTNSADVVDFMGRLSVQIVSPLDCPSTSSQAVTVQLWGSLQCDLHVPIWEHDPIIPSGFTYLEPQADDGAGTGSNWWSSALSLGKGVAGTIWNATTGNWNGALKTGLGTFNEAAGLFMDKPNDPLRATHNMVHPFPPLAHCQGVGGGVRLDATPEGGYTETNFTTTSPAELSLYHIARQPMMFRTIHWSASQAPGTRIERIPVTPMLGNWSNVDTYLSSSTNCAQAANATSVIGFNHTYLSYVSSLFQYWSGSITFKFKFVTTQFHTGRVLVTYIPNNMPEDTTLSLSELTSANSKTFDVAGDKEFTFTAPYYSPMARKSVYPWAETSDSQIDDRFISGWLEMRVIGSLTTTNAVPETVPVFVYISAGPDFFLEGVKRGPFWTPDGDQIISPYIPLSTPGPFSLEAQADDEDELVNNTSTVQPRQLTNSKIRVVQDVGRRLVPLHTPAVKMEPKNVQFFDPLTPDTKYIVNSGFFGYVSYDVNPSVMGAFSLLPPEGWNTRYTDFFSSGQDLPSVLSKLFVFWSGSIEYLFIPQIPTEVPMSMKAVFWPGYTDDVRLGDLSLEANFAKTQGCLGSLPVHETVVNQQRAFQVSVPYYSNFNQLLVQSTRTTDPTLFTSGKLIVQFWMGSDANLYSVTEGVATSKFFPCEVKRALGDDFRFSYLVAPPREIAFPLMRYLGTP
jgi:hypothetical protein